MSKEFLQEEYENHQKIIRKEKRKLYISIVLLIIIFVIVAFIYSNA